MKIGNIEIKGKTVLAPMAGISNSAFRRIVKEMGCALIYSEMVSDKAIFYGNKKTIDMLYMTDKERPIAQQIFGSDKESFVTAAQYIYKTMKPDIIDINMGCPVPKVAVRAQAGAALLKDIPKIKEIVSAVVASVPCPVTVKIRSGWDEKSINAKEVAIACEEVGASAITIHPRTRSQGYSGHSDWSIIKEIKESINIPVIGNGDIKTIYDAKKMIDETNCDLVMIGRASLGNPWIFREINEYLENNRVMDKPTDQDKINMLLRHLSYLQDFKSDKEASLEIRSHVGSYLKGISGSNEVKNKIYKTRDLREIRRLLEEFRTKLTNIRS